jgi:PHD/YefM family antitoxin component YafN of YafNO toxin-antitoxin module
MRALTIDHHRGLPVCGAASKLPGRVLFHGIDAVTPKIDDFAFIVSARFARSSFLVSFDRASAGSASQAALNAPLDLILVRKIGVPTQPELAMGAVVNDGEPIVVRNEDVIRLVVIEEADFKAVCDYELTKIERRRQRYLGSRQRVEVTGRTAIVIDDGVARRAQPPVC